MKEETLLKANSTYEKLIKARKEYDDIDKLLSISKISHISLRSRVNEMSMDDERPTCINLENEFKEIIQLVKDIRKVKVENLENELYSIGEK